MSGKVFLDTNILVYAQDGRAPKKQKRSREIITTLVEQDAGVVSTQVLQEFYVAATRKLGVDPLAAKAVLKTLFVFEMVQVTPALIDEAVDGSILNRISFWDALVVVSAASSGCGQIYSEDLNPGQRIRGVEIFNPFRD
jgi:predicted nucleic acid-binding protein